MHQSKAQLSSQERIYTQTTAVLSPTYDMLMKFAPIWALHYDLALRWNPIPGRLKCIIVANEETTTKREKIV